MLKRTANVAAEPVVVDSCSDEPDDDVTPSPYAADEPDRDDAESDDQQRDQDDDEQDDDEPQGDVDVSDDDATPQHAADDQEHDEEPAVKWSRLEPDYDNGNGNCVVSDEEVSNPDVFNVKPNCNNVLDRFHSSQEAYQLLRSATPDVILPDVPRGRKNCWYIVNNTQNAEHKQGNLKNRFWDNCGVWDTEMP